MGDFECSIKAATCYNNNIYIYIKMHQKLTPILFYAIQSPGYG